MTGHGNVVFSDAEINNLNKYMVAGGFLHIDDNYGMDNIRKEKKYFPIMHLEIPSTHIFSKPFLFPVDYKIHEHDGNDLQAYGIFVENNLYCFILLNAIWSDGWEDPEVHNDLTTVREKH
jgi:hypothetical protein